MGNNYCWFQVKLERLPNALPNHALKHVDSLSLPLAGPMAWPKQILRGQKKQREVSWRVFSSNKFLTVSANLLMKIYAVQIE